MGKGPLECCPCIFAQGPPSSKLRHWIDTAHIGSISLHLMHSMQSNKKTKKLRKPCGNTEITGWAQLKSVGGTKIFFGALRRNNYYHHCAPPLKILPAPMFAELSRQLRLQSRAC